MIDALQRLQVPFHLAAGSDLPLVRQQLVEPLHEGGFRGRFDAFVCNGAQRYRCRMTDVAELELIEGFDLPAHLGSDGFDELMRVLEAVLKSQGFSLDGAGVTVSGPQIVHRGSMLNFAPIGRPPTMDEDAYRNRAAFETFDRATHYRSRLLRHLDQALEGLRRTKDLRITLGGQTSFDVVVRDKDKRNSVRSLLAEGFERVTYFGDALHDGGNDAAILEFIGEWPGPGSAPVEAVPVCTWHDTLEQLHRRQLLRPTI